MTGICRCKAVATVTDTERLYPSVSRHKEAEAKRRNSSKRARRWAVEVCHNWLNRFRKLLVRYEKL